MRDICLLNINGYRVNIQLHTRYLLPLCRTPRHLRLSQSSRRSTLPHQTQIPAQSRSLWEHQIEAATPQRADKRDWIGASDYLWRPILPLRRKHRRASQCRHARNHAGTRWACHFYFCELLGATHQLPRITIGKQGFE